MDAETMSCACGDVKILLFIIKIISKYFLQNKVSFKKKEPIKKRFLWSTKGGFRHEYNYTMEITLSLQKHFISDSHIILHSIVVI